MKLLVFLYLLVTVIRLSHADSGDGLGDSKTYRSDRIRRQADKIPAPVTVPPVSVLGPNFTCYQATPEVVAEFQKKLGLDLTVFYFKEQGGLSNVTINQTRSDIEVFYSYGEPGQKDEKLEITEHGKVPTNVTIAGWEYSMFADRKKCVAFEIKNVPQMDVTTKRVVMEKLRNSTLEGLQKSAIYTEDKEGKHRLDDYVPKQAIIKLRNLTDANIQPPTVWMYFINTTVLSTTNSTVQASVVAHNNNSAGGNETISGASVSQPSSSGPSPGTIVGWIVGSIVLVVILGIGLVYYVRRNQKAQLRTSSRHGAERLAI